MDIVNTETEIRVPEKQEIYWPQFQKGETFLELICYETFPI
jgi:hypothetical protein